MNKKQRYSKALYIDAMVWSYGMTKTEAKEQVKTAIKNELYGVLNAVADGFMNNARLALYND